jgi:glycosyltransferase involved in cell wall biosynthesis
VAYEELREWLVGIGAAREKIRLFYNCADPKKFRAIDRAEARRLIADRVGYFGEEFVVGFVGTLKEYHAVDVLLEAIRLLRWMNLRVHCLIVGDGPCREELVRLARDLGIGSYVRFAGSVEHDRVNEFICACDLMYGYIRKDYGSPIKCYEYLSCGRLVLARNTEELRFVKDLGVGYLFDNPGPDEIAEKIAGFMNLGADEIKLRSVLGREFVVKERSWDLLAREIREMVREVGGVFV